MAPLDTLGRFINHPATQLACRVILGGIFILSGGLKALTAPEELTALFRAYEIIPELALWPLVYGLPWLELISGAFLLFGYLTRLSAIIIAIQLTGFILVLAAVIAMGINLEDCGCFIGLGFHEGPITAIIRDLVLLAMAAIIIRRPSHRLSLDAWLKL
jgi:uncharacterized membrane protein YphA (DoxX/SURF4 family)